MAQEFKLKFNAEGLKEIVNSIFKVNQGAKNFTKLSQEATTATDKTNSSIQEKIRLLGVIITVGMNGVLLGQKKTAAFLKSTGIMLSRLITTISKSIMSCLRTIKGKLPLSSQNRSSLMNPRMISCPSLKSFVTPIVLYSSLMKWSVPSESD